MFPNIPFNFPGYGQPPSQGGDPQRTAAASVNSSSKPSLLTMQDAMGGLLGYDSGQAAAQGLMGDVSGDFSQMFNGIGEFATKMFGNNPGVNFFNQLTGQQMQPPEQMIPEGGIVQPPQQPAAPPPPPPKEPVAQDNGWGGVQNDNDAIQWALQKGDITPQEAQWLMRWQQNDANGNTNFVDGGKGTRNWDYMSSDLTNRNKQIVDKFYKSVSGNWGPAPEKKKKISDVEQSGGLLDIDPKVLKAAKAAVGGGLL